MSRTAAYSILAVSLIVYLVLGAAFAVQTPAWQSPDEPAHYNYIKFIAQNHALPVLQAGDYDQAYNEEFTRTPQNTQSMSIDPLRYENYAPPLYYVLAAPIYALAAGSITALRLFSVLLGALLVLVTYFIGVEVFPNQLPIALGTAAFVAYVPQHLAMLASVNNDSLSELLIALVVLQSLRLFRSGSVSNRSLILLGLTLGSGLLTKATFYYTAVPIACIALILNARRYTLRFTHDVLVFAPALLIAAPLWLRNASVYGGLDVMGLARHNAVVVGQPTTAQWIADHGMAGWLQRFVTTTYQSFWGQFGWMAVPMPNNQYVILGILSALALVGWVWWLLRRMKDAPSGPPTRSVRHGQGRGMKQPSPPAIILTLLFVLTLGGYLYYNLTFVQHQGRYLFPALIPIGLAFSIGWYHLLDKIKGGLQGWQSSWAKWLNAAQVIAFALVFAYLAALDFVALQRYIIPNLSA